jgi:hypothetical protein
MKSTQPANSEAQSLLCRAFAINIKKDTGINFWAKTILFVSEQMEVKRPTVISST